jgi:hypothetical protein
MCNPIEITFNLRETAMIKEVSELESQEISTHLEEIENEIKELEEDFGDIGLDVDDDDEEESSSELDNLNAEIKGTDLDTTGAESASIGGGELTLLQIADGQIPEQSMQEGWLPKWFPRIPNIFKRRAKKIIRKITWLVKKYKKLAPCVPAVTKAVVAFKTGRYGSAIRYGISAMYCIKKRM